MVTEVCWCGESVMTTDGREASVSVGPLGVEIGPVPSSVCFVVCFGIPLYRPIR